MYWRRGERSNSCKFSSVKPLANSMDAHKDQRGFKLTFYFKELALKIVGARKFKPCRAPAKEELVLQLETARDRIPPSLGILSLFLYIF